MYSNELIFRKSTLIGERIPYLLAGIGAGIVCWSAPEVKRGKGLKNLLGGELIFDLSNLELKTNVDALDLSSPTAFIELLVAIASTSDQSLVLNQLQSIEQITGSSFTFDFRADLKNGQVAMLRFNAYLQRCSKTNLLLYLDGLLTNRTSEIELQLALQSASDIRLQTLYSVGHDLGSPLGLVKMSSTVLRKVLQEKKDLPSNVFALLDRIEASVQEAHTYLRNALEIAKVGETDIDLPLSSLDLKSLLAKCVEESASIYNYRLENVIIDFPDGWLIEKVAEYPLLMLLNNLVSNAVKYSSGPEGRVNICVRWARDVSNSVVPEVMIEISDNGIGITEELKATLFKPFHRGENVKGIKGIGLGLVIVRRAVEMLKGRIDLMTVSQGTCFRVYIPAVLIKPTS